MAIPIDVLRNLEKFSKGWFIVADLNVLFHDISFLRSYIVGDPTCQLLTPIAILNKIDAMCSSDTYRGVARTTRQAIAQLEACSRHVRFDSDVEETQSTKDSGDDTDEILNCCQKIMLHGYHVVLITRSRGLHTLAEIRGVHVYDVQHIKRGLSRDHRDGKNIAPMQAAGDDAGWHAHVSARHHRPYSCIRYTPGHGYDRHAGGGYDRHADGGYERHAGGGYDRHADGGYERHAGGGYDRHADGGYERHAGGGYDRHAGGGYNRHAGGGYDRHAGGGYDRHAGGGGGLERRRHRYYGRRFANTRN